MEKPSPSPSSSSPTAPAPSDETSSPYSKGRLAGLIVGLALFLGLILFADLDPENPSVTRMAAVAVLMAVFWISEAIPLAATALIPLVLFPLLGIASGKTTAPLYVNSTIFLFIGGFLIALAMEKWNLHRRIALSIIRVIGSSPSRLVLGFVLASAALSMWISNTATAIMMLAIGLAIVKEEEALFGKKATKNLSIALLLGIAYGCSIGGIATPVGTPPNLSFRRIFANTFPDAPPIGFGQWMLLGVPLTLIMLTVAWFLLSFVFFRTPKSQQITSDVIEKEYQALGKMRWAEGCILVIFLLTALLWVFRTDLEIGTAFTIPGWAGLLGESGALLDDASVAIAMALLLFFIPGGKHPETGKPDTLLNLKVIRKVPWEIVLLFGGGFALAGGFKESGLSDYVGSGFAQFSDTPAILLVMATCGILTFLTELTSNTATTEMILPILAAIGVAVKTNPLLLMIPATISASCAFMMPVATPPNAIVFGSGRVRIIDMVKIGFFLNIIGMLVITVLFYTIGTAVFDVDLDNPPEWMQSGPAAAAPKP